MRRALLFLLLFGSGLAVILYFSAEKKQESRERLDEEQEQIGEEGRRTPFIEVPQGPETVETEPGEGEEEEPGQRRPIVGAIAGHTWGAVREENERKHKLYDFDFQDTQPRGEDLYDVSGITVHLFDPETEEIRTTLRAERGVAKIERRETTITVGHSERVRLFDAVVTLHQGTPMSPVDLHLPVAEADLRKFSIHSSSEVRIEGEGLRATGTGLVAQQLEQRLVLERNGHVQFQGEEEEEVELFASPTSSIEIKRTELSTALEKVEVRLPRGGRVIARTDRELVVEGDDISLDGSVVTVPETGRAPGDDRVPGRYFQAEHARIVDDVLFSQGQNEIRGGEAEITFDAAGGLERLEVEESPRITGFLDLDPSSPQPTEEPIQVEISGIGPLVLQYAAGSPLAEFDLPGPARIEAPGAEFEMEAASGLGGNLWGRGLARATLRGEVEGALRDLQFSGSDVDLRGSQTEGGDRRLFLETERPAHLEGTDSKGRPVDMRSQRALQVELENGELFVKLGREVTMELIDAGLWEVSVGELRNLDLEQGTFTAGGGVEYSGPIGSGTALRAVGHSREHLELFGDSESPATYDVDASASRDLESGFLRAEHIDVDARRARAETRVQLRFSDGELEEEIDCEWFELRPKGLVVEGLPTRFEFEAREISRSVLRSADGQTTVVADRVLGSGSYSKDEEGSARVELEQMTASGSVVADYEGELGAFRATGDRIVWTARGGTRLEADGGGRVDARGRFQEDGLPYVLTATWVEFTGSELQALFPEIELDRPAALPQLLEGRSSTELHAGEAEWMTADEAGLLLSGKARFIGETAEGETLDLRAGSMHLELSPSEPAEGAAESRGIEELVAWDGFELLVGGDLRGEGEILQAGYRVLRMEGRPARFEVRGFVWESDNIEYDVPNVLVRTDQGRIHGAEGTTWEGWSAEYESLQPFESADSTMMVMRNLVMRSGEEEVRADWAVYWLDRQEWLKRTGEWLDDETAAQDELPGASDEEDAGPPPRAPTLFGGYDTARISKVLKEMYFEGNIVYSIGGERSASMQAVYVDVVDGHGWIQDCEILVHAKIGRTRPDLVIRADWLRHSADGSLSADFAEVTACEFAEPDYVIRTKNLRLKPIDSGASVWDVLLKDNALIFDYGLKIPLPRVHYKSDSKGRPTFSGLNFGDSARYGTFVEASVDVDVGDALIGSVAPLLDVDPEDVDSSYRIKASYLNARGLLLDQRFRLTAADKFWMNIYLDGLYDSGEDRGMLRYKEDGGDGLRWILHSRGRYLLTHDDWVDFAYSSQSDPGVQAEFDEGQFVAFERRDSYLRWRKAEDENYYFAEMRWRSNDFRNYLERLPDVGWLRSPTPFAELWGQPLLYAASTDAAYLRRREGTSDVVSPFDPLYDDGLGNREVLRGDTRHRVEAPFDLGLGGVRISPYTSFAGTVWSEGVDPADSPTRGAVIAGAEAQSTFFRTWKHGVVNSITPSVGYRGDLVAFEDDGEPLVLDAFDTPLAGRYLDASLRSRWRVPGGRRYLDAAVRGTHADAVPTGVEDGWQPIRVLGELLARAEGVPFAIVHDGQYDLDDGDTVLSYTSLSVLPHPVLGVEVSYNRGLDNDRRRLYEAVNLGARWDATSKWQVEARQSFSRIDNSALSNDFLLRRLGHDFVFELAYGFRSGEGGSSLTFKVRPLIGWRPPTFGSMQTLQRARL